MIKLPSYRIWLLRIYFMHDGFDRLIAKITYMKLLDCKASLLIYLQGYTRLSITFLLLHNKHPKKHS